MKPAVLGTACVALQIHAQMQDAIFYPAMRPLGYPLLNELASEHAKMRSQIAALQGSSRGPVNATVSSWI